MSIKKSNKSTNKDLNTSSSSEPYVTLSILFLMIRVTISGASHVEKENYKLIITSINESNKTNIKDCQKLFLKDMTNIGDFDLSLLNVDSLEFRYNNSVVYDIKYIKNLNSSNSLHLVINNLDAYI